MEKDKVETELIKIVGSDNVFTENVQMLCYRFGNVIEYRLNPPSFLPDFVVKPQNTEQISSILKLANRYRIPVVAWGGGTDFTGANSPINGGIVIDMKGLNKIHINKEEPHITAGAGTTLLNITDEAEKEGFLFPHEITAQPSATLGGAIATNSFGYRSGKYGSIRNLILGIEAVLPTGAIIRTKPLFKTSTGYDLTSLLVGSEGTLGIITEATLRLDQKPENREISFYLFDSFEDGFEASKKIQSKMIPEFFSLSELSFLKYSYSPIKFLEEYMDSKLISKYFQSKYVKPTYSGKALEKVLSLVPTTKKLIRYVDNTVTGQACLAILMVGFEGEKNVVRVKTEIVDNIAKSQGGLKFDNEEFYEERFNTFGKLKEVIFDHFPKQAQNFNLITFDAAMPTTEIVSMKDKVHSLVQKYKSVHLLYADLYSSLSTIGFDMIMDPNQKEDYTNFLKELKNEVLRLNGSISFAHGIGTRFLPYLEEDLGKNYMKFMKETKNALDPSNILNPGKLGDFCEIV